MNPLIMKKIVPLAPRKRKTSSMRVGETALVESTTLRLCSGDVFVPLRVARKAGWSRPVNSMMFVVRPVRASTRLDTLACHATLRAQRCASDVKRKGREEK